MDLGISEKVAPLLERVRSFINEQVMPVEHEFVAEIEVDCLLYTSDAADD